MQVSMAAHDCFTRIDQAKEEHDILQVIVYFALAAKSSAIYNDFSQFYNCCKTAAGLCYQHLFTNSATKLME
ncbi:MAG: hypothetical protein ACEY3J_03220 [Arsenophonus sp.]